MGTALAAAYRTASESAERLATEGAEAADEAWQASLGLD